MIKGELIGLGSNAGFMSHTVSGVSLGFESLLSDPYLMTRRDHKVFPVPWNKDLATTDKKLKIGWYVDDPLIPVTPGIRRAVREAADLLEKAGHTLVPFKVPKMDRLYEIYFEHMLCENGKKHPVLENRKKDQVFSFRCKQSGVVAR